jgi:heme-degrading monooxygenase HmoA
MFSRIVSMELKPNTHKEFASLFDKKVVPTLRKQKGFKDVMLFVVPGAPEVVAVSFWESKENAENYSRSTYKEVLNTLEKILEGAPEIKTFEVAYSTSHKIGGGATASAGLESESSITSNTPGVGG